VNTETYTGFRTVASISAKNSFPLNLKAML